MSCSHSFAGRPLIRWASVLALACLGLWVLFGFFNDSLIPSLDIKVPNETTSTTTHTRPYPPPPKPPTTTTTTTSSGNIKWEERAQSVKEAFIHTWKGYQAHAAGYDELRPVDAGKVKNFNGWGVTLYDALDTMWLMGLRETFDEAVKIVAKTEFTMSTDEYAPFFETVIRYLGGLLSAYALSGEPVLLSRADELGSKLLPAFNTTSGLPDYAVNTVSGKTRPGWHANALFAEALSNQMEFKYLAHLTTTTDYYNKTDHVMQLMYKADISNGLYPSNWNIQTGAPNNAHYTVGSYSDSAYEYFLKQYLLSARSEPQTLELYLTTVNAIINNLIYITPNRHLLYVTDMDHGTPSHKLEHLSCFFPGLLALGVHTLTPDTDSSKYTEAEKERHLWVSLGLAETCWTTYNDQLTGLGPDEVRMVGSNEGLWITQVEKWEKEGKKGGVPPGVPEPGTEIQKVTQKDQRDYTAIRATYLLRPETIETFFYLWKVTGDLKWRERGWSIFESLEKHSKTKYGYASVNEVDSHSPSYRNEMPSYFLAETLKYLYLLFSEDENLVSLKDWVFNTEAHPLPIFQWNAWEKKKYNIPV